MSNPMGGAGEDRLSGQVGELFERGDLVPGVDLAKISTWSQTRQRDAWDVKSLQMTSTNNITERNN